MRVLQYSIDTLAPEPHPEGAIRVSLDGDRVLTHIKTGRNWADKDLGPETEKVLSTAFILHHIVDELALDGASEETSTMKLEFFSHPIEPNRYNWYSRNSAREWVQVDKDQIPLPTRCLLLGRCAVSLQDRGFSPKGEAR